MLPAEEPQARFWTPVVQNVAALVIFAILVAVYHLALGFVGRALSAIPLWTAIPLFGFAAYGVVAAALRLYMIYDAKRIRPGAGLARIPPFVPLRSNELEIDLVSIAPLVVLFSTQTPQINLILRLTNLSKYDLTVTHLTATVWFSQPTVELTIKAPIELEKHSTRTVFLHKLLEDSATERIKEFFARDDWTKFIAIDVTLAGVDYGETFERGAHFDLRSHDIKGVLR
jgi:hypothetical protein